MYAKGVKNHCSTKKKIMVSHFLYFLLSHIILNRNECLCVLKLLYTVPSDLLSCSPTVSCASLLSNV
jgi:hypothetical protein